MAATNPDTELMPVEPVGLMANPAVRQLLVMLTLAGSIALGIAVVLWAWTPNYMVLHGSLTEKDASEIVTALQQAGIEVKVDQTNGSVMIPATEMHNARLKLASQGLPRGDGLGFELLQQEAGFGTSRLVEAARYQRAMEGELARTISTLSSVQTARVHLAQPKQSVFVRKRKKSSASVVVKLFPGRILEKGQVASIVYMVASSVPELEADDVTVIDQKGTLLSGQGGTSEMMLNSSQFDYTSRVEERYKNRIEDILSPILGAESVRAQVTAEVDFTRIETTEERFNPTAQKELAIRSEQINEASSQHAGVQGVPGALSNQPPVGGVAPERVGQMEGGDVIPSEPINSSKQATRNYELDKVISHTRMPGTSLRRLSVAVVVDNPQPTGKNKDEAPTGRTPEELEQITQLVKEAMGFNEARGDTVRVINAAFQLPPEPEPLPEQAIWEQPWVWDVARQVGGVLLVLVLIFVVLKPTMKRLLAVPVLPAPAMAGETQGAASLDDGSAEQIQLSGPGKYENTLDAARGMVQEDPKRVAQVVKKWVHEDAG